MNTNPLTREDLGHLNYLHSVLAQPLDNWDGFYTPQSENMNFALRFQLGFASYAVAALGLRTPAYRAPYSEALRGAVERMLDVKTWGYWRIQPAEENSAAQTGHVAMLMGPRKQKTAVVPPPPGDPIQQDNVQYSGHLSTMIALYERASGDQRFDDEFTLSDPESGVEFSYTHSRVAERIFEQMRSNYFHGVACEPSCAYVPCNNHAMSSNTMYDATHGADFAAANKDWIEWVRRKLVLKGATMRGLFGACFLRDVGVGAPVAFQFTDSWGLAFLQPFDRVLARKLYKIFRKRISHAGDEVFIGSAALCDKMEISDRQLNTAFGLIAARGLGDTVMATGLQDFADNHFAPRWEGGKRVYSGAPRTLHTTALLALGRIADGKMMYRLFHEPTPAQRDQPELVSVSLSDGAPASLVGVSRAEYDKEARCLRVELLGLSEREEDQPINLACSNITQVQQVTVDDAPWTDWSHFSEARSLNIRVKPANRLNLAIYL